MAFDGSELLGAPEVAGVLVNPLGTFKTTVTSVRGGPNLIAGKLVWGRVYKKKLAEERATLERSATPHFVGQGHLAVTSDQVALLRIEAGNKLGGNRRLTEVLGAKPLSSVSAAELGEGGGPGASLPLTITFADGEDWVMEVGRIKKGEGEKMVAALQAKAASPVTP